MFLLPGLLPGQPPVPPAPTNQPAVFSLANDRAPMVYLGGQWKFHPGDDPHYADPSFEDSHWTLLDSTRSWSSQGFESVRGYAWYRFRVTIPAGSEPYSLLLPSMSTSYQCFVDGKLIRTAGKVPAPYNTIYAVFPAVVDLPSESRQRERTFVVALRHWKPAFLADGGGGPESSSDGIVSRIGTSQEVHYFFRLYTNDRLQNDSQELDLTALNILAAIVAFALYVLRRNEREYLWFGIAALVQAAYSGASYFLETRTYDVSLSWLWAYSTIAAAQVALLMFYKGFLRGRISWLFWAAIVGASIGPFSPILYQANLLSLKAWISFNTLAALPYVLWIMLLLVRRSLQRVIDARLLLMPVFLVQGQEFGSYIGTCLNAFAGINGLSFLSVIVLRHPVTLSVFQAAQIVFLLTMLAILLYRFVRTGQEREKTDAEMAAARTLQQVLIPERLPSIPGLTIAAAYYPAQEVGGDFFQIMPAGSGATVVILGDVSGKGLGAAMTVALIVGAARMVIETTESPSMILAALNRRLHGRGAGFTTCLVLRISPHGAMTFANAGQLAPYWNGGEIACDPALPLGLDLNAVFGEVKVQLQDGDRLTLLTDGVPEAANKRELFGFARTESMSTQTAGEIATAARSFGQTDDITVLSIDFSVSVTASMKNA